MPGDGTRHRDARHGERRADAVAADGVRRFDRHIGHVVPRRRRLGHGHDQRIGLGGVLPTRKPGQAGDDHRPLLVAHGERQPPWLGADRHVAAHCIRRHGQHAERGLAVAHAAQHAALRPGVEQWRLGAEVDPRKVGEAAFFAGVVDREYRDREAALGQEGRGHDLAPDPHDDREGERAFVARQQASQDGGLARRPQQSAGGTTGALGLADAVGERHAAHDEIVNRVVDLVDLVAQGGERRLLRRRPVHGGADTAKRGWRVLAR